MGRITFGAAALLLPLLAVCVHAHPVPRSNHDRTIVVRLSGDRDKATAVVEVEYRLEVDELTVVLEDMAPFAGQIDLSRFRNKPGEFYTEFTRLYAPILADNLVAMADGKPVPFACVRRQHRLRDEKGEALGHLRCDFVFRASFPLDDKREKPIAFAFREGNYELQPGKADVSVTAGPPVRIVSKVEADAEVKKRTELEQRPGDEEKLRRVSAVLAWDTGGLRESEVKPAPAREPEQSEGDHDDGLFRLFLESGEGLWWLLLPLAVVLGAAHALTPGHGKTLVAAYLVGERGTTLHALVLGVVTTLTHTGIVLLIALGLLFANEETRRAVQSGLGLAMGLAIALLGFWLLIRRLAGRADHIHIGGHGHHHHHHDGHHHHHHHQGHAVHDHDEGGNVVPRKQAVGWWGLVVLGMSGGIVPCWDAVAMLVLAVGMDRLDLALPMLVAFSAGLAGVLVLIGVLVVHVRKFTESRWGEGRLVRALPILSAVFIATMGVWLCYESVHAQPSRPASPSRTATAPP